MTSNSHVDRAKALLLAAGLTLALVSPALAQWPQMEPDASGSLNAVITPDAKDEDVLKDIDIDKLDWGQLDVDASTLHDEAAAKKRAARAASSDGGMTWTSNNQPNGASAVSVKEKVSPFWDARVGTDMTVTHEPTTMSELLAEKSANGGNLPQSGGSAWAAVTAPGAGPVWDKTAVEARVNPNSDQSSSAPPSASRCR